MSNLGGNRDLGRIQRRPYQSRSLDKQQRLYLTMGVGAALLLIFGLGVGFAVGRATAPEPAPVEPVTQTEATMPAGVVEEVATATVDAEITDESFEETTTVDEEPPPTPKQTAPKDGARIDASRVYLKWSKVEDDSAEPVTYAFEIQDRLPSGKYGKTQIISGLKSNSYSARVLYVKRRWRVWAADAAGNKSDRSGWRYYQHTPKPVKKSKPKASSETT